jgi:hypothetical protein
LQICARVLCQSLLARSCWCQEVPYCALLLCSRHCTCGHIAVLQICARVLSTRCAKRLHVKIYCCWQLCCALLLFFPIIKINHIPKSVCCTVLVDLQICARVLYAKQPPVKSCKCRKGRCALLLLASATLQIRLPAQPVTIQAFQGPALTAFAHVSAAMHVTWRLLLLIKEQKGSVDCNCAVQFRADCCNSMCICQHWFAIGRHAAECSSSAVLPQLEHCNSLLLEPCCCS